jgi:hypothetical protein
MKPFQGRYSLRHTAWTSVNQIEHFYARHLPLAAGVVRNLQTFAGAT